MSYQSVDQLQNILANSIFRHTKDKKKAAGRALGTLVEIITFYLLKTWGYDSSVRIERGLVEYGNPEIEHNVEFTLHPVVFSKRYTFKRLTAPLSSTKLINAGGRSLSFLKKLEIGKQILLSKNGVLRNSCVIACGQHENYLCFLRRQTTDKVTVDIVGQRHAPYAMFECKRVGVEEGMKKGPQTIEKAKQGAYVARAVSSLQKVRTFSGALYGVIPKRNGTLYAKPYERLLTEVIDSSSPDLLHNFVLTIGVVSNHGNWFTSKNPNKELRVLSQSYDWLLFLTDAGLSKFIRDVLMHPSADLRPAREAFLQSYAADKKKNQFTKVQMHITADGALQKYFQKNLAQIESWFEVISPLRYRVVLLKKQITCLANKNWRTIFPK